MTQTNPNPAPQPGDSSVPPPMPPAIRAQIEAKIGELEVLCALYLRSLSDEQRRRMAKMGPDSVQFVRDAIEAVIAKPDVMPRRFNAQEMIDAFEAAQSIEPIAPRLQSLAEGLDDAETIAGNAAYVDALEVYDEFGTERKNDSSLTPFYERMAQRFAALKAALRRHFHPPKPQP